MRPSGPDLVGLRSKTSLGSRCWCSGLRSSLGIFRIESPGQNR